MTMAGMKRRQPIRNEMRYEWEKTTRCPYCGGDEAKCNFSFTTEGCSQMKDPAVPVVGIWLRREGDYTIVYVEKEDGKRYEAIREHWDGAFSHHISASGLAGLHRLDHIQSSQS